MKIVERIFLILQEKKIKSVDLAKALGIHKGVVSKWKTRSTNPPSEFIVPISEFLNVSIDFLLTGEERNGETLSREEIEVIYMLRELHPEIKRYIIKSIKQNYEEKRREQKLSTSNTDTKPGIA